MKTQRPDLLNPCSVMPRGAGQASPVQRLLMRTMIAFLVPRQGFNRP